MVAVFSHRTVSAVAVVEVATSAVAVAQGEAPVPVVAVVAVAQVLSAAVSRQLQVVARHPVTALTVTEPVRVREALREP